MLEWLGIIVVDNVFSYILDQSAIGEHLHNRLTQRPEKEAFQLSLEKTFQYFETQYPQLAEQKIFRQSFQKRECARILSQLLLRDKHYDSTSLAYIWADALHEQQTEEYTRATHTFEPIAHAFLDYLDKDLRVQPALQGIHDSQAFERMATGVDNLVNHFVPNQLSDEDVTKQCKQYCEKLYDQWKMLDFRGIQHLRDADTPVSIPLIDVFVLPDVHEGIPEYETLERDEQQKGDKQRKEQQKIIKDDERVKVLRSIYRPTKIRPTLSPREDLRAVLAKHHHLVILGDPGSGKSTLLKYLMLALAKDITKFNKDFQQIMSETQVTSPLYISLSEYAQTWLSHELENRSLKNFLFKHLSSTYLDPYTQMI